MKTRVIKNTGTVIHADLEEKSVEELIEQCRQKYYSEGCDKFKNLRRER